VCIEPVGWESAIAEREPLAVTEIVVAELLAGARTPTHRSQVRSMALSLPVLRLRGLFAYGAAAARYRACGERGETLRGITDCLVAVPAIEARAPVLHLNRDFDVLARKYTARRRVRR
jgi:predicted nucleic acid-binding protein